MSNTVSTKQYLKAGVLINPLSGRVRKKISKIRYLLSDISEIILHEATSLSEIKNAADNLIKEDIGLLVIIGGDGTVQAILDFLYTSQHSVSTRIVIIPGGTTNMTAGDIGVSGSPIKVLKRFHKLMNGECKGKKVFRPVLRIQQKGRPTTYGMFFGAGLIPNGAKYFNRNIRSTGITGEFASFIVMLSFLAKLFSGRSSEYLRPTHIQFSDNMQVRRDIKALLLFATTLDRLLFGLRPYWGTQSRPVKITCIRHRSVNFWRSLITIILCRGYTLSEENGYYSENSQSIQLNLDGDFLVDGEIFTSERINGPITISATAPVTFIVP